MARFYFQKLFLVNSALQNVLVTVKKTTAALTFCCSNRLCNAAKHSYDIPFNGQLSVILNIALKTQKCIFKFYIQSFRTITGILFDLATG